MNIETKWLEDFTVLASTHSFSRSAELRHLTQPAFSRRIRALENALGCELIDRTRTPVQLTPAGECFQVTARNLITQIEDCANHLKVLAKGTEENAITIAISHTLALSFFPEFLKSLREYDKRLQTRLLIADVDDGVLALQNGLCDFLVAFDDSRLKSSQFADLFIRRETLIPVCRVCSDGSAMYDLDAPGTPTIPYLAYSPRTFLGRTVSDLLVRRHFDVRLIPIAESSMADSLRVLALQGLGVAWVPSFAVVEDRRLGLLAGCGGEAWEAPLSICVYRRKHQLSSEAESAWANMRAIFSTQVTPL